MAKPVPARLDGDRLVFDAPEYGVAPGQAAVLYAGDRVLGGGWIAATEARAGRRVTYQAYGSRNVPSITVTQAPPRITRSPASRQPSRPPRALA